MQRLESFHTTISRVPLTNRILGYGSFGIISAIIIQYTIGFAAEHPLLLALSWFFWVVFSSSMTWTLLEIAFPAVAPERAQE